MTTTSRWGRPVVSCASRLVLLLSFVTFECTAFAQHTFTDIVYPGATTTYAEGINDLGWIVGEYVDGGDGRWHGFLLKDGAFTRLDYPGAGGTFLYGINSHGDIVGTYCLSHCGYFDQYPFLYSGGVYSPLHEPEEALPHNTVLRKINDFGQIAGNYVDSCFCKLHGVLYSGGPNGAYTTVDRPGYPGTSLTGINNAGTTVGASSTSEFSGGGTDQGFIRSASGVFTSLTVGDHSYPIDINDSDQVVGQYLIAGDRYHAYVVSAGVVTTIDPPGAAQHAGARGINASGSVVGQYIDSSGVGRGFLASLSPMPQVPTTKEACKKRGWMSLTRADGSLFKNQGDCIQYVNTGK